MMPQSTNGLNRPSKTTQNAANYSRGTKSQDPKGKSMTRNPEAYCDLCDKGLRDANALRMHIRTSSRHKGLSEPSASESTTLKTAVMGNQDPVIVPSIPISSEQSKGTTAVFRCDLCNQSFRNNDGLERHKRGSKKHRTLAFTIAKSGRVSRSNREVKTTQGLDGDLEVQFESMRITEARNEPRAAGNPYTNLISFVAASNTAPGQMLDSTRPTQQDKSPVSTLSTGKQTTTAQASNTAYHFSRYWSDIPVRDQESILEILQNKSHSVEQLSTNGYRIRLLTAAEVDGAQKCNNCGVVKKQITEPSGWTCRFHQSERDYERGIIRGRGKAAKNVLCPSSRERGGKGCITWSSHDFVPTEAKLGLPKKSPARSSGKRAAVVLDCEMVGVLVQRNLEVSELVRLCAVDFLTREILVDTYVNPKHRVVAWRSKFSGVTKRLLTDMIQQGRTVNGWQAARALLWQHIDEDTILIGHSLNNDLNVLGMIHTRVVDSAILTKDTVGPDCNRRWALKTLCQQFLDWEIQADAAGHDCIEDTFAAREILLWCLQHPDQLRNWAAIERDLIAKKKAEKAATMQDNNEAKEKEKERKRR